MGSKHTKDSPLSCQISKKYLAGISASNFIKNARQTERKTKNISADRKNRVLKNLVLRYLFINSLICIVKFFNAIYNILYLLVIKFGVHGQRNNFFCQLFCEGQIKFRHSAYFLQMIGHQVFY